MPSLRAKERAGLPGTAPFAYIDSRGRRRLPIHDASHVRNALSRFNQVAFEDDAARDQARSRLLRAAKKHGIMPIGFISAQLQPELKLPKGLLTFLLTDIEGSTSLLRRLGDDYAALLSDVRRRRARSSIRRRPCGVRSRRRRLRGLRACPRGARGGAAIQRAMRDAAWPTAPPRLRIRPPSRASGVRPIPATWVSVHAAARICFSAHGEQIVISAAVHGAVLESFPDGVGRGASAPGDFAGCPSRSPCSRPRRRTFRPTSHPCDQPFPRIGGPEDPATFRGWSSNRPGGRGNRTTRQVRSAKGADVYDQGSLHRMNNLVRNNN